MRELIEYAAETQLPGIETSLQRKRNFVEQFFITGELGVAYINAVDPSCDRTRAKALATSLMETDQFVRDLIGLARKNIVGSVTGLLAEHTSILADLRDGAKMDGKWAPAIAAEIARGKALGLYDRIGLGDMANKDPAEMSTNELQDLIESVSRLPEHERRNIAQMLLMNDGGLLIEGDDHLSDED